MDDKELLEYKQKLKGLSLKELNDILTHIHPSKVPEKFKAVQEEILLRPGGVLPKAEAPVKAPASAPSAASAATPAAKAASAIKTPSSAAAAKPKRLDFMLTAASVAFIALAVYLLLIPFMALPGATAVRGMLSSLPPHF